LKTKFVKKSVEKHIPRGYFTKVAKIANAYPWFRLLWVLQMQSSADACRYTCIVSEHSFHRHL